MESPPRKGRPDFAKEVTELRHQGKVIDASMNCNRPLCFADNKYLYDFADCICHALPGQNVLYLAFHGSSVNGFRWKLSKGEHEERKGEKRLFGAKSDYDVMIVSMDLHLKTSLDSKTPVALPADGKANERGKKNKPEYPCFENALLAATQHSNKHWVSFVIGQSLNDITSHKGAAVLLLHTIDGWRHDVLGDLWAPSESSKK